MATLVAERMTHDMIDGAKFILFLSAALVLAAMPGPGILYVLGRTLNGGRREGVISALGTFWVDWYMPSLPPLACRRYWADKFPQLRPMSCKGFGWLHARAL